MKSKKMFRQNKPYKMMSNGEIIKELKDSCEKYVKIYKSIPIANQILVDLKLPRSKFISDLKEKNRHDKLYKIATERGIDILQEWYDVNISSIDVLKRIETAYYEYISSITKKSRFDVSDIDKISEGYQNAKKKVYSLKQEQLIR